MKEKQLGFYKDTSNLFTEEELQLYLANDEKFYKKHAEKEWLDPYHSLKMLAEATQLPSLTSFISDTPRGSNGNRSETEEYALKSVVAQERLDFLHDAINRLPNELSEIIKKKFLTRNQIGKRYSNTYIADVLGLSHATFYRLQNQALSELGAMLYQYNFKIEEE